MTGTQFRSGALVLAVLAHALASAGVATRVEARQSEGLAADDLATVTVYPGGVDLLPRVRYERAVLTVSGGDTLFSTVFANGELPSVEPFNLEGDLLPDGVYSWEVEFVPDASAARDLRIEATENGGEAPGAWPRLSGTFTVLGGLVETPRLEDAPARQEGFDSGLSEAGGLGSTLPRSVPLEDDDAAVGSRVGVEEESRAAAAKAATAASVGALQHGDRESLERSDLGASTMGRSLEPLPQPANQPRLSGEARPARRSISPDGKNGRPRAGEKSERRQ